MKVATKIFVYMALIMTIAFNVGTTIIIYYNYENSMAIYQEQAVNEYYTKMYFLQNEMITVLSKGETLEESVLSQILWKMQNNSTEENKSILIANYGKNQEYQVLYSNFKEEINISDDSTSGRIEVKNEGDTLLLSTQFMVLNENVVLVQGVDIVSLIGERERQINFALASNLVIIVFTSMIVYFLAKHLTKPITDLIQATSEMSDGNYKKRVPENGNDEISLLAKNYNIMSAMVEEHTEKLEEYARTRDDFVRNFSHELKTPLTSMVGYSDILRSKKCNKETILELSNYIFTEGKRLEHLSAQMIALMKMKQSVHEFRAVKIEDIVSNALFSVEPVAVKKKCTIKYHFDITIKVLCNRPLIETLLVNLLENSIKASPSGNEVTISTENQEGSLKIIVVDKGVGMKQEELAKITEPFYMVDTSRKGKSTGIGLAICDEIIKLHGSTLCFESEPDKGTSVSFILRSEER